MVVIGIGTLFSLFALAPIVILFDTVSPFLEIPALGAKVALNLTQNWSEWPIWIQTQAIANHHNLPLAVLLVGLGFLYQLRIRLIQVRTHHLIIGCIPILLYGVTYPWQLAWFGSLQ